MLVVIGIFLLLAGLTVAFLTNFRGSAASQGTSQLYGWLNMARQRAIRDRNPYGLRLVFNQNNPGQVDQLQYIEQPEDFYIPNTYYSDMCPTNNPQHDQPFYASGKCPPPAPGQPTYYYVEFSSVANSGATVDFTGGFQQDSSLWPVQPGDYLEVNGSGKVHRIASIALGDAVNGVNYNVNPTTGNVLGLVLVSQPDLPTGTGWQYRVIRRSRVVGEDALRLPQGVVIDLSQTGADGYSPAAVPPQGFDILFGSKGQVIGSAAAYDKIVLWVREKAGTATDNDPNLIVINTRSGSIAAYRVDTTGGDYYSETRSGQTSPQ
jgi:hypothetical protein